MSVLNGQRLHDVRVATVVRDIRFRPYRITPEAVRAHVEALFNPQQSRQATARGSTITNAQRAAIARDVLQQCEDIMTEQHDAEKAQLPPVDVLKGQDLVDAAAKLYREDPSRTSRQVYELLQENGQKIGVKYLSFQLGTAPKARELAGAGPAPSSGDKRKKAAEWVIENERDDEIVEALKLIMAALNGEDPYA